MFSILVWLLADLTISPSTDEEEEIFPGLSLSKWLKFDRNGREGYKKTLCEMLIKKPRRSITSVRVKGEQTPTLKFLLAMKRKKMKKKIATTKISLQLGFDG